MNDGTFNIAIDLGTTSAKVAVCRSGAVEIITNQDGACQTPCAVWLNPHGKFVVGRKAKEALLTDSANVQLSFIRDLGSTVEYIFPRSSLRMKPEELASELLKSLRCDAKQLLGQELEGVVITTPSHADLAYCAATQRAAALAGFSHSFLIQEPVAAALAGGVVSDGANQTVLIYDFGGNRLNASIVRVQDGIFTILGHSGDFSISGASLDRAIVETIFIPEVRKNYPLLDFDAKAPQFGCALAKLNAEAEAVKQRLDCSNATSAFIPQLCADDRGRPIDFHFELTRAHLEMLATPLVERSISICKHVLGDAHLTTSQISNVIPVGGMAAMPFVRQKLQESFDQMAIPVSSSVDPATTVVKGAAKFAGMQRLPKESPAIQNHGEFELELNYQPISPDPEPLIGGIVRPHDTKEMDFTGFAVEFLKVEPQEWRSGKVGLSKDGRFIATLSAEKAQSNTFRIELSDVAGVQRSLFPDSISITVTGASIAQPGLTYAIGLALSDNTVLPLFEKGMPLPARRRVSLRMAAAFSRGQSGDALRFPLIEGENKRADRNREIGVVAVPFENISRDVPAGTEVEITIQIDDSRQFRVSTYIPILDEEFEHRIALHSITPTCGELAEQLHQVKARLISARKSSKDDFLAAKEQIAMIDDGRIAHVEYLLSLAEHNADAARQCAHNLNAINSALDEAENAVEWASLRRQAEEQLKLASELLARSPPAEAGLERMFRALHGATYDAIAQRSITRFRDCMEKLHSFQQHISQFWNFTAEADFRADPDFWRAAFQELENRKSEMTDSTRAEVLIALASRGIHNNDLGSLQQAVRGLIALLPPGSVSAPRTSTLTSGDFSVSSPPPGESREITHRSDVDRIVEQAIEVFNRGQEILAHQHSEDQRREILAGLEIARTDLLRAAELGSVRARENLRIADDILARVRDSGFGLSHQVFGCLEAASEAAAKEDWQTAVDKLRIAKDAAGPTTPEVIRKNLAVALTNRGVATANKLGSLLTEGRGGFSSWKPPTSEWLNAALELAKQAKQDLEEAARIDSKSEHIQRNLREVDELLNGLSSASGYGSVARSVETPNQGPRTTWLKELMQKLRPTHKPSQAPDERIAGRQDRNAATTREGHGGTPLQAAATSGHVDVVKNLLANETTAKRKESRRGNPDVPGGRIDNVHFSVTSPPRVLPGSSFVLDVWAHLKRQKQAVIAQAREAMAGGEILIQSKGPIQLARGTVLTVLLKVDGMIIDDPQDMILWEGEIGNARFPVLVPVDAKEGSRSGLAMIYLDEIQIAKIYFTLTVGREPSSANDIPFQVKHHRKAFASYASVDRDEVLGRIQGMQKIAPDLDVFLDVVNLRSGEDWEKTLWRVIPENDVFYLFWSAAAKASPWVEKEWRCALNCRGEEFIDPVPLVSPDEVRPPDELGKKHFNDWILAYRRGKVRGS